MNTLTYDEALLEARDAERDGVLVDFTLDALAESEGPYGADAYTRYRAARSLLTPADERAYQDALRANPARFV